MLYETGATFAPAVQIDPILPATVIFALDYPSGKRVMATGTGDRFGAFAGTERWPLDEPGIYHFHLEADWQGHSAASPQMKESQKAKISAPGHGPDWGGIFRGWPQSKQSSMSQFLSGAGNWPPRGIFAARKEMGL